MLRLLLIATLCFPFIAHAEDALMGPVYPGSVKLNTHGAFSYITDANNTIINSKGWMHSEVYLSKDDPGKVIAFYKQNLHPLLSASGNLQRTFLITYRVEASDTALGVAVGGDIKRKREISGFDDLQSGVQAQKHTQADLDKVKAKYANLNSSLFEITDEKGPNGEYLDFQQKLYRDTSERAKREISGEELGAKIQKAMQEGKSDEVGQLLDERGKFDPWKIWLPYFDELEKHAYRTYIIINHQPSGSPQKKTAARKVVGH
jgi:hypothetical protein